jgi:hypothetical protein
VRFPRQRCIVPTVDLVVLAYSVEAERGTAESEYRALCTPTYVCVRDSWRLGHASAVSRLTMACGCLQRMRRLAARPTLYTCRTAERSFDTLRY